MSNDKSTYDYGKCHVCGEQMKEKRINQDFWLKGKADSDRIRSRRRLPSVRKRSRNRQGRRYNQTSTTMSVPVVRYAKEVA